jgi:hypothetical protein
LGARTRLGADVEILYVPHVEQSEDRTLRGAVHQGSEMKTVKAKVVYECGRCSNIQRREIVAKDGLVEVPNVYCGRCIRQRAFTVMSMQVADSTVVEEGVEVGEAADSKAEEGGLGGQPEVPPKRDNAAKAGGTTKGRKPADESDDGDREPEDGEKGS